MASEFPESLVDANAQALCADDVVYATERGVSGARQWNDLTDEDRDAYRKNARPGTVAVLHVLAEQVRPHRPVYAVQLIQLADELEAKSGE